AALEAASLGIDLEQPVDGLGFKTGRLGHALGGAPGRSAQQKPCALCGQNAEDGIDERCLADAGPAGDDQDLGGERQHDCLALSGSIHGQGSLPFLSCSSRSAMPRSALYRPARKTQSLSPTLLATTVPSANSRSSAVRIKS